MIRLLLWFTLAALSLSPALAQDGSLEKQARKLHAQAGGEQCARVEGGYVPDEDYEEWKITFSPSWGDGSEKQSLTLIRIFCGAGAYNLQHSYYVYREYEGLTPLAFATPSVDVVNVDPDDFESAVESITVVGLSASLLLTNSEFDPATNTITAHSLWRGIGDASSSGSWNFKDGEWRLTFYEVDASYDGEINPKTVLDYRD